MSTLTAGKLRYLLADLATVPRAALVVEDRWSSVFKLDRVRPAVVADLPEAGPAPAAEPTTADVRRWAPANGHHVADRGRLRPEIWEAYRVAREAD